MSAPELSLVIPVYNEEEVLPRLFAELDSVRPTLGVTNELIFVNDGSRDRTLPMLEEYARARKGVRVLDFSRNFGHQPAVSAGIDASEGAAIVVLDADLQDPPQLIPEMIAKWRAGADVVSAVRKKRHDEPAYKRLFTHVFYRLMKRAAKVEIPLDVGDFRLISREVAEQVKRCPEHNRYVRGIIAWVGFRHDQVEYDRPGRAAGETKYGVFRLIKLALDGLASFSYIPLQLATFLGFGFGILAFVYFFYVVLMLLIGHHPPPGWTSLAFLVLFLGGVQLVCLGTLGEYMGRVYDEVRARPNYIVRREIRGPAE
jgi:glycosyltransferase involved in cell wall biosynthesis